MPSRPENIPQDVWDIAHEINLEQLWGLIPDDPDDVKLYKDTASIARAIMQAEARGYARGVEAAAEVADAEFVKWQTRQESSVRNRHYLTEIAVHGAAKDVSAGLAAQIRALSKPD